MGTPAYLLFGAGIGNSECNRNIIRYANITLLTLLHGRGLFRSRHAFVR